MNNSLWKLATSALTLTLLATTAVQAQTTHTEMWPLIKNKYFQDKPLQTDADKWLILDAPKRAEDAAVVPITITSLKPQTASSYIKDIYIVIDNNPEPYSADFHLNPDMKKVELSVRMRFQEYTTIRAIAEMNDGSLHMVSRFVKASGGCSAPAQSDPEAVQARLGKMQIRMRKPELDQEVQAQVIVSHPNYNGLQFNQKTRQYIPADYVKNMTVTYGGKQLFTVDMGISFSQDPSIRFLFKPEQHAELKAVVTDSEKRVFSKDKKI